MITKELYERWKLRIMNEEVKLRLRRALVATYESRFGAMPPEVAAAIDATHHAATLRRWLGLITASSREEIDTALCVE
jgi:hypothetical protein